MNKSSGELLQQITKNTQKTHSLNDDKRKPAAPLDAAGSEDGDLNRYSDRRPHADRNRQ